MRDPRKEATPRPANFYHTPMPKTLTRLQARDARICIIEKVTADHDDNRRYYVGLASGYRWSGWNTTGKNFDTVQDVLWHLSMIEVGVPE